MMLTPEQAAATWCPMVRIARHETIRSESPAIGGMVMVSDKSHIVGGCNTDALGRLRVPASCCCIAKKCAMWRWADKAPEPRDQATWWSDEDYPATEPPRPAKVPANAVWIPLTGEGEDMAGGCWEEPQDVVDADNAKAAAARRGYCGLAGSPAA